MSEVQDLKNYVLALDKKIDNLLRLIQATNQSGDKSNEVLNLIHSLGFERQKQNNVLFDQIMPDLIRRLYKVEQLSKSSDDHEYKVGDHFVLNMNKGKKKNQRYLIRVTEDGLKGFMGDDYIEFWKNSSM